jgi:hypothetical protein
VEDITQISTEEWQEIDIEAGILQYLAGNLNGQDYWAYVVMRPSRYAEYCTLIQGEHDIELGDFGEIIEDGYDKEPPEDVRKRIEHDYKTEEFNKALLYLGEQDIEMEDIHGIKG